MSVACSLHRAPRESAAAPSRSGSGSDRHRSRRPGTPLAAATSDSGSGSDSPSPISGISISRLILHSAASIQPAADSKPAPRWGSVQVRDSTGTLMAEVHIPAAAPEAAPEARELAASRAAKQRGRAGFLAGAGNAVAHTAAAAGGRQRHGARCGGRPFCLGACGCLRAMLSPVSCLRLVCLRFQPLKSAPRPRRCYGSR